MEFSIENIQAQARNTFSYCDNEVSEAIYKVGRLLTALALRELNIITKIFGPYSRPGKIWENASTAKKAYYVIKALELFLIVIPVIAALLGILGMCCRLLGGIYRPPASLLKNEDLEDKVYNPEEGISFMTYNVALMPNFIRNVNGMRSSKTRAHEIAEFIKSDRSEKPDVVCFQEVFDDQATAILCTELSEEYPYILYNVAPTDIGLCSGLVICSKYPILDCNYRRYPNPLDEDCVANKGLLGVTLGLGDGKSARVYNTHMQSKIGETYREAREAQCGLIKQWMEEDCLGEEYEAVFLAGDFNMSQKDEYGEDSVDEYTPMMAIFENFNDPYTQEEHEGTFYNKADHWGHLGTDHPVISGMKPDHTLIAPWGAIKRGSSHVVDDIGDTDIESPQSDHRAVYCKAIQE